METEAGPVAPPAKIDLFPSRDASPSEAGGGERGSQTASRSSRETVPREAVMGREGT
jgi:hypothetical protein